MIHLLLMIRNKRYVVDVIEYVHDDLDSSSNIPVENVDDNILKNEQYNKLIHSGFKK